MELSEQSVLAYIQKNRGCTVQEIAEAHDVPGFKVSAITRVLADRGEILAKSDGVHYRLELAVEDKEFGQAESVEDDRGEPAAQTERQDEPVDAPDDETGDEESTDSTTEGRAQNFAQSLLSKSQQQACTPGKNNGTKEKTVADRKTYDITPAGVFQFLEENQGSTLKAIAKHFKVPEQAAEKRLTKLREGDQVVGVRQGRSNAYYTKGNAPAGTASASKKKHANGEKPPSTPATSGKAGEPELASSPTCRTAVEMVFVFGSGGMPDAEKVARAIAEYGMGAVDMRRRIECTSCAITVEHSKAICAADIDAKETPYSTSV